jgi:hypothetical protein
MIIKRYDGDNFVELFPKTTTQKIFDASGTTAVFDSNNKIKPAYLPDSVFDSLYFYGVTSETSISSLISDAFKNAFETNRSPLGYYYVAGQALNLEDSTNYFGSYYSRPFSTTSGSNQLTGGDTTNLKVGMQIEQGSGIQSNTKIASITNATTLVMDKPANANGFGAVSFGYIFATYLNIEEAHTYTRNFTLTQNNGTITGGDTGNLKVNMSVTGAGIRDNTVITGIPNATTLNLSSTASETGARTLTFAPSPYSSPLGNNIVSVELGDWFVLSKLEGEGTYENQYLVVIAVVNNTYELMKGASSSLAGASGIVPAPVKGQQAHFLRGDGTWVIPTNTTYSGSTSITLAAGNSFQRAALTGDVTADANNNSLTIANDVVTFAKMQNIAANTIVGRVTADTGDAAALTATQVRTLLNVEDGANAYVHPNHSGDVTSDADGETTIGEGKVLAGMIASDAVETAKIKDSNVTTDKLAASAVSTAKIENGAVTDVKIGSAAVTEAKIAAGAVATAKIADLAVSTGKIADLAVSSAKIAAGAVIEAKIGSGAVTETKIGTGAVTETKIGTGAVATAKIANGAVTEDKIGSGAVTAGKIGSNAVTTVKINNAAVTNAKLANMAGFTIKGKNTTGAGAPLDLTTAEVRTLTNTVALFFQSTAPSIHADGATIQTGTLWFDTAA